MQSRQSHGPTQSTHHHITLHYIDLYPDDEQEAALAAVSEFTQHIPPRTTTYTQLVPYSYNTLLENILDLSHVPFAHHQLQGTRADAGADSDDDHHVIDSNSNSSSTEEGQHSVVQKPSIDNIVSLSSSSHTNNTNQKKDHRHGFSFYFRDQTMRMPRMGTGTFRAPYSTRVRERVKLFVRCPSIK
jgi:phenylpropionate dioxygenase-like ring-hydroxylating dioxygenase large terminal subunit